MGRRLRYVSQGGALVEVSCRTVQGRYLPEPSSELNALIVGVLARAKSRYPVSIHACVFMSNHYHLLLSVPDADRLGLSPLPCWEHFEPAAIARRVRQVLEAIAERYAAAALPWKVSRTRG